MKQIEIIKTYGQKRCLIVDDVPDIRTSLKRILIDFGAKDIDTAGGAEEAIDLCTHNQYDIVLADYNLGTGKNGQQLLEELRYHKLLKNTALFVVISGESSSKYVLHTLEYQPDDYVNKPVSRDSLRPRLDNALLKSEALTAVKKALDDGNSNKAIKACRTIIGSASRHQLDACKMLGELLCEQGRFQEALDVYQNLDTDRPTLWAQLGLAKTLYGLGKLDQAEQILLQIIESNHLCVDAQDLLANVYEASGKLLLAQRALSNAINISPQAASRQREMGRISSKTDNVIAATHAYRAALKLAKNSCHEIVDDYINLTQSALKLIPASSSEIKAQLIGEASETLKQIHKKYDYQPIVKMYSRLLEADLYDSQGNKQKADALTSEAKAIHEDLNYNVLDKSSLTLCIGCAEVFIARGEYDDGERLLQAIAALNTDSAIAVQIDKLLREPQTKEVIQYATKLNKSGIAFYENKQLDKAIAAFDSVLKELPNHIGINLNLIQALLSKNKEAPINNQEIAWLETCLKRVGNIDSESNHFERYNYLIKKYDKLIADRAS